MFDNPSVAQQVSDTVRRIVGDTERIRDNTGKISRASVTMERNFASMVNSTSQIAANLQAVVTALQGAGGSSNTFNRNMGQAANNAGQTANNVNRTQQNTRQAAQQATRLSGVMTGIGNIIKGTILVGLAAVGKAFIDIQKQGFALNQTLMVTKDAFEDFFSVFRTGVFGSVSDFAKARTALASELGSLNKVTDELVESTVELTNVYNVSEKAAAGINAQLFRWTGRSAQLVKSSQQYVVALAKANGVAPGKVIEQMAQNTEELARYSRQGAEGFSRQLIVLNKMGVSMKSISALADRMVMDFEGSLESAAKLQTFLPGFDISGIQFASQFGTPEQVATELQTALQRSGISSLSQLPRSLQNAIGGSLGMSLTEIENLLTNQQGDTEIRPATNQDMDGYFTKLIGSTVSETAKMISALMSGDAVVTGAVLTGSRQIVNAINAKNAPLIPGTGRAGRLGGLGRRVRSFTAGAMMQGSLLADTVRNSRTGQAVGGVTQRLGATRFGSFAANLAGRGGQALGAVGRGAGMLGRGALAAGKIGARFVPGLGLALGAASGVSEFMDSKNSGLETSKALVNAIVKPLTFGLVTPFNKVKNATEELVDSKEKEKKASEEAAVKNALAAAGVKDLTAGMKIYNELYANKKAAYDATVGGAGPGFFSKAMSSVSSSMSSGWDWITSKFSGKYHSGGVIGDDNMVGKGNNLADLKNLKPQETIAILEKGEVVLTPAQMSAMGRAVGGGMRGNLGNIINGFLNSFNLGSNKIVQSIRGALTDKGGFLGKIGSFFEGSNIGQTISNKLSGITSKLGPIGEQVQGFIGGMDKKIQGFAGGLMEKGSNFLGGLFGGNKSGGKPAGGMLSSLTGGNSGILGKVSGLFGKDGGSGLMGKASGLLGSGGLKNAAAGLVGKIPGIGGIASSLIKGGGVKGIGTSLLKGGVAKLGGAKIGAMLGSVIPGGGTIIGAALGAGISKLANTKFGKAIGSVGKSAINLLGKTPVGAAAKKIGGAVKSIGGKIGGLFGRKKKKPEPTPAPLDVGNMASLSGMLGSIQGMPNILSMFGGAGDAGLAGKVAGLPGLNVTGGSSTQVTVDTANLEGKIEQLINLMRSGGIAVNLDGRKVSTGLMEANRYG